MDDTPHHPTQESPLWERVLQRLPGLELIHQPAHFDHQLLAEIQDTSWETLLQGSVVDQTMASVLQGGMLLIAGDWDQAHRIVQDFDTPEARYWHGILHRQEPDKSNAHYWFRRVPAHPVYESLSSLSTEDQLTNNSVYVEIVKGGHWDPGRFVDKCVNSQTDQSVKQQRELEIIQQYELKLLLTHCRKLTVE